MPFHYAVEPDDLVGFEDAIIKIDVSVVDIQWVRRMERRFRLKLPFGNNTVSTAQEVFSRARCTVKGVSCQ